MPAKKSVLPETKQATKPEREREKERYFGVSDRPAEPFYTPCTRYRMATSISNSRNELETRASVISIKEVNKPGTKEGCNIVEKPIFVNESRVVPYTMTTQGYHHP